MGTSVLGEGWRGEGSEGDWVGVPPVPPTTLPCTLPPAGTWTSAPLCLPQSPEPTPYLHPPLQQAGLGMGGETPPSTPSGSLM